MSEPGIPTQCRRSHRNPGTPHKEERENDQQHGKTTTEQRRRKQTHKGREERKNQDPQKHQTNRVTFKRPALLYEPRLRSQLPCRSTDLRHATTDFKQGGGTDVLLDAPSPPTHRNTHETPHPTGCRRKARASQRPSNPEPQPRSQKYAAKSLMSGAVALDKGRLRRLTVHR